MSKLGIHRHDRRPRAGRIPAVPLRGQGRAARSREPDAGSAAAPGVAGRGGPGSRRRSRRRWPTRARATRARCSSGTAGTSCSRNTGTAPAPTRRSTPGFAPVLLALAVGSALNDRLINNLDAPLSNYMPDAGAPDRARSRCAQLLAQDRAEMSRGDSTGPAGAGAGARRRRSRIQTTGGRAPVEAAGCRFDLEFRAGDSRLRPRRRRSRVVACARASATGCASANCWPTTASSRATSSRRRAT